MLTSYDIDKKTTYDIILPLRYKNKINPTKLLDLTNKYINYFKKNDTSIMYLEYKNEFKKLFKEMSHDEIYELYYLLRIINYGINLNKTYIVYPLTNLEYVISMLSTYIEKISGGILGVDELGSLVKENLIEKMNIDKNNNLYEYEKDKDKHILYIGDDLLLNLIKDNQDIVKEMLVKIENDLIDTYRNMLSGNSSIDVDRYMLPHYVNFNNITYNYLKNKEKEEDNKQI